MKFLTALTTLLFFCFASFAQHREKYSRARILLDKDHTIAGLAKLGLAVDHGEHKKGAFFVSDFSATEIDQARDAGYGVTIDIDDVQEHYRNQNKKKAAKVTATGCAGHPYVSVPAHFHLGSYAGYFTYAEMIEMVDSMRLLYPGLISAKQPIGSFLTSEGRPIYWVRISDNPDVDQPLKPQMLTSSVHHAREPGSLSSNIFFLWYLLENYATDPQVKAIIDNTELYFIPCLNPDGYLENIATDPAGGGLWRKNRRDNLDGSFGVDLNRNYGLTWAYDDIGSSPVTTSQTYRGTAAFSEPETQAMKWFAENHDFKLNLNFHTYNNAVIYPWGHVYSLLTPDSVTFSTYGSFMTEKSNYRYGTCDQTLSYVSNGGSDDWMYGETTTKNKIYAFTPEIGSDADGFYAPAANIQPDCEKNVSTNLHTASLLLPYTRLTPMDDKILIDESGYLHYTIQRLGMQDGATYTVSITALDSWLTVPATPKNYMGLALMQKETDSFSYSLSAATPNGQLVRYVLNTYNGLYYQHDTVSFYYGRKHNVSTPGTSSFADWTNTGWNICTSHFVSAPSSLKSNTLCNGNYPDNFTATLTLNETIDLTFSTEAWLRFYARWGIESKYDYVAVFASEEGTGLWQPLCGQHTRTGTTYQLPGQPVYDAQQPEWVKEHMSLNDFLGQKILLRFELVADMGANYEGFYVDDIEARSVQDTTLSIGSNETAATRIRVYPNPTTDRLTISVSGVNSFQPLSGSLCDVTGRIIRSFELTSSSTSIDVSTVPTGIYMLKVTSENAVLPVQKVLISR